MRHSSVPAEFHSRGGNVSKSRTAADCLSIQLNFTPHLPDHRKPANSLRVYYMQIMSFVKNGPIFVML